MQDAQPDALPGGQPYVALDGAATEPCWEVEAEIIQVWYTLHPRSWLHPWLPHSQIAGSLRTGGCGSRNRGQEVAMRLPQLPASFHALLEAHTDEAISTLRESGYFVRRADIAAHGHPYVEAGARLNVLFTVVAEIPLLLPTEAIRQVMRIAATSSMARHGRLRFMQTILNLSYPTLACAGGGGCHAQEDAATVEGRSDPAAA